MSLIIMCCFIKNGNNIFRGDYMEKQSNQAQKRNNSLQFQRALLTGFMGGAFWSLVGILMYYFNFMEVSIKSVVLQSWTKAAWTDGWIGNIATIFLAGIFSIGVAIIYYLLFKKYNSMWAGFGFGVAIWFILFYLLYPLFSHIPPLNELSDKTIISSLSIFILYGAFIGYSISFDYNDNRVAVQKDLKTTTNG